MKGSNLTAAAVEHPISRLRQRLNSGATIYLVTLTVAFGSK